MPAETEPDCERGEGGADDCKAEAGAGAGPGSGQGAGRRCVQSEGRG